MPYRIVINQLLHAETLSFQNGTMNYERTTQVPNVLFDEYLQTLNLAELKLLLVIIRQTNGWIDKRTGKRKARDRISHRQFISRTKLSRRVISSTIQALVMKGLVLVTDPQGIVLEMPGQRKGRQYLYYESTLQHGQKHTQTSALREPGLVQKKPHNKTNCKTKKTKPIAHADALHAIIEEIKNSMRL